MKATNTYAAVDGDTPLTSVLRSMILTNEAMLNEAEAIIKSTRYPTKRAYWRGRRDVYESHLRSCQLLLGIDSLIESDK